MMKTKKCTTCGIIKEFNRNHILGKAMVTDELYNLLAKNLEEFIILNKTNLSSNTKIVLKPSGYIDSENNIELSDIGIFIEEEK